MVFLKSAFELSLGLIAFREFLLVQFIVFAVSSKLLCSVSFHYEQALLQLFEFIFLKVLVLLLPQ